MLKLGREVELGSPIPPTKQISFEIEESYYEKLRENAEKAKISIANQCRDIVENYFEKKNKK